MIQEIQVAGSALKVVVPPFPWGAMRTVEWSFKDAVAMNVSPFTGQTQRYVWPGADSWCPMEKPGMLTLPQLTQAQAKRWKAFLMECRGISMPFLMSDPAQPQIEGDLQGSVPLVDSSVMGTNRTGSTVLHTKAWTPSRFGLLEPGDYVQVGYRMHVNLNRVNTDVNGKAALNLFPSLREAGVDAMPLVFANSQGGLGLAGPTGAVGLFCRAENTAVWSTTVGKITSLSFAIAEWR